MDARKLALASLIALAGLWSVGAKPPQAVPLADAATHPGQSIAVEGVLGSLRAQGTAWTFTLTDGAQALAGRHEGAAPPPVGPVRVTGTLQAGHGRPTLLASAIEPLAGKDPVALGVDALAEDPARHTGATLSVTGTVKGADLVDPDGSHAVKRGEGPWPKSGKVRATGTLAYDGACACYRLDAWAVSPWTP